MPNARRFRKSDAADLVAMFQLAVLSTAPDYYTAEQARIWARRMPDEPRLTRRCLDGRHAFVVCNEEDLPVAYGDLEVNGHLDLLYCHPDYHGKGYASAVYDKLEETAKTLNINEIFVEASEAALKFFLDRGFTTTKRRVFDMDGAEMHNYAMRKGIIRD